MEILSSLASATSPVYQGLAGGIWGTTLAFNDIVAREVQAGQHVHMTAFQHIVQVNIAEGFAAAAFGIDNATTFSMQLLSSVAVGLLHYFGQTSDDIHIRQWCLAITDNILTVSRVVNLISLAAIFYFGNIVMGVSTCVMYTVALLDKAGYLPELAQKVYYNVLMNQYFLLIAQVLVTSGLIQVFAVIYLAARVAMIVENWCWPVERHARSILDVNEPGRLSDGQFVNLLTSDVPVEIDHDAVYKNVPDYNGPTPVIDYEQALLDIFDERSETAPFQRLIRGKAGNDDIYRAQRQSYQANDPVAFARTSLAAFLHQAKTHGFAAGVAVNYEDLERKLKILTQYLMDHKGDQAIFVDDCLAKLAIEGGQYCQAGKVPAILQVYREVAFQLVLPGMPEHVKVKLLFYQILANTREQIFQRVFQSEENILWHWDFTRQLILNKHIYNTLVEAYGEPFGLLSTGSENDVIAQQAINNAPDWWIMNKILMYGGICALGHSYSFPDLVRREFFDHLYTPDKIVAHLREATSFEGRRPSDIIIPWLTAWIYSRPENVMTATQKQDAINELQAGMPETFDHYSRHQIEVRNIIVNGQKLIFDVVVPDLVKRRANESVADYTARRNDHIIRNAGGLFPKREASETDDVYIARVRDYIEVATLFRDKQIDRFFKAMLVDFKILRV